MPAATRRPGKPPSPCRRASDAEQALEAGQAVSVTALPGFSEEGLEVLANDGTQDGVLGVAGLIRPVTMGHALA